MIALLRHATEAVTLYGAARVVVGVWAWALTSDDPSADFREGRYRLARWVDALPDPAPAYARTTVRIARSLPRIPRGR